MQRFKKVLIFAYYWPPAGGVAVQRFLKFSKLLPEFGWEPVIVTVKNGSYAYYDNSLLKEVPPAIRVYHTGSFEPFEIYNLLLGKKGKAMPVISVSSAGSKTLFQKLSEYIRANFFIPDARKGWVPYAVKQAEEILRHEKMDAVITTGPPHSTHLIGLQLKKKFGVKWIADFRDPWTGILYNDMLPRTKATKKRDLALETEVLTNADRIVVISPGMKKQFEDRTSKIDVIFNGYDEDSMPAAEDDSKSATVKEDTFVIRFLGNFVSSHNAPNFWKAIAELRKNELAKIKLEFTGRVDADVQSSIAAAGIADITEYHPFTDNQTALKLTYSASLLLFTIFNLKNTKLVITGKLFEYLASCREIISFGPVDGDAAAILKGTGRKPMIDFNDYPETLKQLENAYAYWLHNGHAYTYTSQLHQIYTRRNQTASLAKLLNSL